MRKLFLQYLFCLAILFNIIAGCSGSNPSSSLEENAGGGGTGGLITNQQTNTLTGSWVEKYGRLRVSGNKIVDKNGNPIQLRGMSLFWSNYGWGGDKFYNPSVVSNLVTTWNANIIRAAMGIENNGGYFQNPNYNKNLVKTVVDAAISNGIYVIIDWHDHNIHSNEAVAFFSEIAGLYKTNDNLIFEIYNEPDNESWSQVKQYALQVIQAIRNAGADQIIVVGTPTWSQDVDVAANDPITGYQNIAYTLHFYAGTHKQYLRDKALTAMNKGLALFVTEWGTCDASGNGGLDLNESQTWINFMNQYKLSWCNWSLNDKVETASALVSGASTTGPWPDSQLTTSGKFVKSNIILNGVP
ncbi:MAG: glycoside hydrolase family 5 protein [Brevinematia bacterium]